MAKISYEFDNRDMRVRVGQVGPKVDRALALTTEYHAAEGTAYMKEKAPWTDRTTNARNGLHAIPKSENGRHEIIFSHTVHYGIWLEIANSGRYQIIMPTVRHEGELLMGRLSGLLGRIDET